MKNKKISMYIVGVMLVALCFAGCGKKKSDSTKISETSEMSETEESTTGVEDAESEPGENVQTPISSRWNIDIDAVKGKAHHMTDGKACWEGRYHTSCEDDGKELSGEDVLSSVAKGRHSFIYMYMRGETEATDGVSFGPTLFGENALSMNELFYMFDLAAGYNEGFDITGFNLIDLDGNGVREMVVRGEYKDMYAYYVFYTIGSNAYLTSFDSRSVSHINEDGSIINSNNEPMFLNFSNVEPFFDYKAWKLENDFETVYFVEGHETTKEEYDSYITKWNSERTECTYTDFREDTLGKAYE